MNTGIVRIKKSTGRKHPYYRIILRKWHSVSSRIALFSLLFSKKDTAFSKAFFLFVTSIFLVSVLSSCSADTFRTAVEGPLEVKVKGVTIAPRITEIDVSETNILTAVFSPSNATNQKVTWKSSDPALATIDATSGKIKGIAEGGPVTITVTTDDGSFTDQITIEVKQFKPVTAVTIVPQDVFKGRTSDTWTIKYTPTDASIQEVIWTIANDVGQATIIDAGSNEIKVKGVVLGKVTITATATSAATGGVTVKGTKMITVKPVLVENVTIDQAAAITLYTNVTSRKTTTLTETVTPSDAENKTVTWSSKNTSIATVNSTTGEVTAVDNGTVVITATANDAGKKKATKTITVKTAVESVKLTPKTVNKGETVTLTATVSPANASDKTVTWSSSNTNIATVSSGVVSGVGKGTAYITATANDTILGKSATTTVTVNVKVTGVTVTPETVVLYHNGKSASKTTTLTADVQPTDANNKTVTWSGSNSVASVNTSGVVTALSKGTATITATTTDGNKTDTSAITVKTAVENITLKPVKLVIQGDIKGNPKPLESLIKSITPTAANDQTVTWSLSSCSAASLINNSEIQPMGTGTCTLTATAADGQGATATTTVTVTTPKPQNMIPVNVTASTLFAYAGINGGATVDHKFAVSQTEMTWGLWETVYNWAGNHSYTFDSQQHNSEIPRKGDGTSSATDKHPVTRVTWRNAMLWCNAYTDWYNAQNGTSLTKVYYSDAGYSSPIDTVNNTSEATISSSKGGQDNPYVNTDATGFRLPTNIEWEFVARLQRDSANSVQTAWSSDVSGGTTLDGIQYYFTPYNFASGADEATGSSPYSDGARKVAWFYDNSCHSDNVSPMALGACGGSTKHSHIVGTRNPNGLDIYDMNGNAWEWVSDIISGNESRYVRSGSWTDGASGEIVVSYTGTGDDGNTGKDSSPSGSFDGFGFRVFQTCPTTGCSDLPTVD